MDEGGIRTSEEKVEEKKEPKIKELLKDVMNTLEQHARRIKKLEDELW